MTASGSTSDPPRTTRLSYVLTLALVAGVVACSGGGAVDASGSDAPAPGAPTSGVAPGARPTPTPEVPPRGAETEAGAMRTAAATTAALPALRQELLEMRDADQAERSGETGVPVTGPTGDIERADRLREIIAEHGWPTNSLVGTDGATAAWLIAQHADFDVAFQQEVIALMQAAVAADDADPTQMAFLEDRVAVNTGQPQTYGSQISCTDGRAAPATPIRDEDQVDQRRQAIGLEPLEEYYAQFDEPCAAEG